MWLCVSTMPGTTTRPRASTVRAPLPAIRGATCAIAPSFTATSWTPSIPEAGLLPPPPVGRAGPPARDPRRPLRNRSVFHGDVMDTIDTRGGIDHAAAADNQVE